MTRQRQRQRPSKSCVTIATAIALAFCMRIWMTGVFGLIDASHVNGEWIKVDALIVGRNSTTFASPDDDAQMYFCARVEFTSHFGENITAISTTDCVLDALTIVIGNYIPIIYNPAYPKEFIEQDVLESELISLKVMVGVGIAISLILSGAICLLLNRQHRRRMPLDSNESTSEPTESPEVRKEKILSMLYTVTVLEDTSNTVASSVRSMGKLDDSSDDKTKEAATGGDTEAVHGDNNGEKQSEDADENDASENNKGNSALSSKPESLKHHQPPSTLSFLSSLIRPTHDAECCICLDCYEPGEVICASKSEECNHVFHKECLIPWMMKNNDRCPLCRVDFMKDKNDDPEA
ncbi:unnamed protein product [Cylindrotheca closterium]|uniref:RING-type E3 ubiquitin transferase n=1 Tax=Cylindrotheca closterium TaxID=2856 RepID=A0AAD2JI01_9STRA|nr:unnamed protein product [Cylindrotheca closterium]